MKKIILVLILWILTFSISSCKKEEVVNVNTKKDFIINVKPFNSLWNDSFLEKSWKIEWKDDITLSSQATWRVWKVFVKEWDKVIAWQTLMSLNDTVANYGINIQKSSNLIEKMQINYDSTKVSLDKQIFDLEISLEKIKNSYELAKINSNIDISQAEDNLSNTDYSWMDTKSSLELQKMDNSISKMELDYNNTLLNNEEAVSNLKNNIKKEYLTQKMYIDDIINFWDKIFDVSWLYKWDAEDIEKFFWAKDTSLKIETENTLLSLINIRENTLKNMNFDDLNEEKILNYLSVIDSNYLIIDKFLSWLEKTINNSIVSVWQLSQSQIDLYVSTTNAYQTQFTVNNSTFIWFKNSATTFLKTYKNNEISLVKQIELLKKDRDIFVKNYDLGSTQSQNTLTKVISSSEDALKSLELQVKQTEESLRSAKQSRDLTLKWLENSLSDAYISNDLALKDYEKLTIKATIDWVIWDILVDVWQDILNWTPIVSITSDKASEVELYFKDLELSTISSWVNVYTTIANKTLTGSIYSISSVSDDSLNYKVLAIFNEKIQNLWGVIDVKIPVKSSSILIPIKNITLVWTNKWIVNIYDSWKIVKKEVLLWKMYKDNIEFISFLDWTKLDNNMLIIMNDVSNFDENKFNLKVE